MPVRHQIRRTRGWRWPTGAVRVDRATPWGNPFVIGTHGTHEECVERHSALIERGMVTMTDREHVQAQRDYLAYVTASIGDLVDKDVACWCAAEAACHGDTLMRRAARFQCEAVG